MASQTQLLVSFAGQTRYMEMLPQVDDMPYIYNVISGVADWTLRAGCRIVPGSFTALQKSGQVQGALAQDRVGQAALNAIRNLPVLEIAFILFVASTAALGWLYSEWLRNYIWLVNRICLYHGPFSNNGTEETDATSGQSTGPRRPHMSIIFVRMQN